MSANVYKSSPLGGTSFSETCVARWGATYRSECRRTLFETSLFSIPDARLQGPREPPLPCKFLKTITFRLWHRRGHRFDPDQSTNAAESSKGTRLRFSCSSESGFHAVRTDASPA